MIRRVQNKSIKSIESEWDAIANLRYRQISNGIDVSYKSVLVPEIFNLSNGCDFSSVIDVGCGVGFLTQKLGQKCDLIVAVDISEMNLRLTRENCKGLKNIDYYKGQIEDFAVQHKQPQFTLAIANMTIMTVVELTRFLKSIYNIVIPGGKFIVTLPHPCFWPIYWEYISEDWFDYNEEIIIEAPFKISAEQSNLYTTHIHRPIQNYFEQLIACGFEIEVVNEPVPADDIELKYNDKWEFPRFLAIRCERK